METDVQQHCSRIARFSEEDIFACSLKISLSKNSIQTYSNMSANVEKSAEFDVKPAQAWAAISDFNWKFLKAGPPEEGGNSPADIKDVKGKGKGATRTVFMMDGSGEWGEKQTMHDKKKMRVEYVVTSTPPAPFDAIDKDTFVCYLTVEAVGDKTKVTVGANYDPHEGLPPPFTEGLMYQGWVDAIGATAANEPEEKGCACTIS